MDNPEILWAQSRDKIFITINVENIEEQQIKMEPGVLNFVGKNNLGEYNVDIKLLKTINSESSSWTIKPRCVTFILKKEPEVFWNKLSAHRYNNLRVDWNKWDIVEDSEDDETKDMSYGDENMYNNFKDFTKTLPSELMNKDFTELFPGDINEDISDESESSSDENLNSTSSANSSTLDIENLDIDSLDENLLSKMEEGRITRKDRESLSSNEGDITEDSCGCGASTDDPIPENKEVGDVAPEDILDKNQ